MNYQISSTDGVSGVSDGTCAGWKTTVEVARGPTFQWVCGDPMGLNSVIFYSLSDGGEADGFQISSYAAVPDAVPVFDFMSVPSLLQSVLVVAAVFILFAGYRAGDKL